MGLFGSLFGEKSCGVCGKELGLLGKWKLEDGYICKDCASLLSPFFSVRRASTLDQIKDQLDYREKNKEDVAKFNVTRTLGTDMKILLDEDAGNFMATRASRWRDANPDVIPFSAVTGCDVEVKEKRTEIKRELPDGKEESYNPPRYDIDYDIWVTIHVNNPYFDEIEFKTNDRVIDRRGSVQYEEAERVAHEIRDALTQIRTETRESAAAAAAPKIARTCPFCGATTIPDASGRCEYCGGAMGV